GASGRIMVQPLMYGQPEVVTPPFGGAAAPVFSPDDCWLLYVHTFEGQDSLAIVDAAGKKWPQKLVSGDDFYMQPAWGPSGEWIAWISWNFPQMPWDGARLFLGRLVFRESEAGLALPALVESRCLAGDEQTAVQQPTFSPDGRHLAYLADSSGWEQLYLYNLNSGETRQLTQAPGELGQPAWQQGRRTFVFSADGGRIYFIRNRMGTHSLWRHDLHTGTEAQLQLDPQYSSLEQICLGQTPAGERLAFMASGDRTPKRLLTLDPHTEQVQIRARAANEEIHPDRYVPAEHIQWEMENGEQVYGLYYDPRRLRFTTPPGGEEKPPLILIVHGGPTGQAGREFNAEAQFFATRGYAVLLANYRGSTGYGRAYRNALRGNLGVHDVEDSVAGARRLVALGEVDGSRLAIIGSSSGGATALLALARFPGFFKAGVVRYPVVDQLALAEETHKFEARYNDQLIGPLPAAASLYRERSPLSHLQHIKDPLALFHGEDDPVVPLRQSLLVKESLARRGIPHIFHSYPGESHGFRQPETRIHYYKEVEKFLRRFVVYP
ncbi:MAG TPA: S9 family peptidase, partial [Anaerolineales bacterium]|nr:S9 family peptidase [Anaerolineales bacterium]